MFIIAIGIGSIARRFFQIKSDSEFYFHLSICFSLNRGELGRRT